MMFKNAALALSVMAAIASAQSDGGLITTVTVYDCSASTTTQSISTITESSSVVGITSSESTSTEFSTTTVATTSPTPTSTIGSTGASLPPASGSPPPFNNTATIAGFSAIGMIIASSFVLFM
ncbi:hypothetical protein B7463_g1124, partial [Scytalidium lignicola]